MTEQQIARARARIEACRAAGERAYDLMYEARDPRDLAWQAELATDSFREAYRLAVEEGWTEEAAALMERLQHVKAIARQLR